MTVFQRASFGIDHFSCASDDDGKNETKIKAIQELVADGIMTKAAGKEIVAKLRSSDGVKEVKITADTVREVAQRYKLLNELARQTRTAQTLATLELLANDELPLDGRKEVENITGENVKVVRQWFSAALKSKDSQLVEAAERVSQSTLRKLDGLLSGSEAKQLKI